MNKLIKFCRKEGVIFDSTSGDWLAVLRIGAGLTLIAKILSEFHVLNLLYGSHGFVPIEISSLERHSIIPTFTSITHFSRNVFTEDVSLRIIFGITLVLSIFLTLGLFTRFSAFICWCFQIVVVNSSYMTCFGVESLLMALLFYSFILPSGRYRSLDSLYHGKPYPPDPSMGIYHFVIQLHICLIYWATGIAKEVMPTWHDGSYLWSVTSHPQFATVWTNIVRSILAYGPMAVIMSWFIVILEILYPLGIWFKRLAKPLLIFIILMHIYISAAVGLWIFGWVMIVFNLAAFGDILYSPVRVQEDKS